MAFTEAVAAPAPPPPTTIVYAPGEVDSEIVDPFKGAGILGSLDLNPPAPPPPPASPPPPPPPATTR
jgi:hypothetical protein